MTNETEAPERIWLDWEGPHEADHSLQLECHSFDCKSQHEYIRADISDAKDKRLAKLTEALQSIVIEHDSPIWGEDHEYRAAFERSVAIAEAALAQTKGETND